MTAAGCQQLVKTTYTVHIQEVKPFEGRSSEEFGSGGSSTSFDYSAISQTIVV